jgi:hypothetical protein
MMKTLWTVTSTVGTATVLAIFAMCIWGWMTGHLNAQRIDQLRSIVMATPGDLVAPPPSLNEVQEEADPVADSAGAAHQIAMHRRGQDRVTWATRRLTQEKEMLAAQLEIAAQSLRTREAAFEQRQEAWLASIEAERTRRMDTQFAKAVGQLELIPGYQAKAIIESLVQQQGLDEGVTYLDAMSPRGRAKVLKEFRSPEEIELAARLLERMRIRGTTTEPMESQPHANNSPDGAHTNATGWDSP